MRLDNKTILLLMEKNINPKYHNTHALDNLEISLVYLHLPVSPKTIRPINVVITCSR